MSTTLTAREIGDAWLSYVADTFILEDGSIRPDVQEEYLRLEETDTIRQERELWRSHIDLLIDRILQCPAEQREQLLASTDARTLAFLQDRIQCGTELLAVMVQKELKLNLEHGAESLPGYFRLMLMQDQAA